MAKKNWKCKANILKDSPDASGAAQLGGLRLVISLLASFLLFATWVYGIFQVFYTDPTRCNAEMWTGARDYLVYTFVVIPSFILLMCCCVCCNVAGAIGLARSHKDKAEAMKAHMRGRGGRPDLAEPLIVEVQR